MSEGARVHAGLKDSMMAWPTEQDLEFALLLFTVVFGVWFFWSVRKK